MVGGRRHEPFALSTAWMRLSAAKSDADAHCLHWESTAGKVSRWVLAVHLVLWTVGQRAAIYRPSRNHRHTSALLSIAHGILQ